MPEAARALLEYSVERKGFERVVAPVFAQNERSRRAAETRGLRLEGVRCSCVEYRGRCGDQAISMLRCAVNGARESAERHGAPRESAARTRT